MTLNAYRTRAERGEVQLGTWITMIRTPSILTLLKAAGLDFARVDMEHSPFSMETIADPLEGASDHGVSEVQALSMTSKASSKRASASSMGPQNPANSL